MNIVVSSKSYYPMLGGSIVFASMLAKAFTKAGHAVKIITRTNGVENIDNDIPVIRRSTFEGLRKLAKWSDVILQVDASWRDALPFLLEGVPWFPTVHRGKVPYGNLTAKGKLLLALESAGYNFGRAIGVADYVTYSWGLKNAAIPNPYDDEFYYKPKFGSLRDIDLLYVGRVSKDKGVFVLLDAIKRIVDKKNAVKISTVAFVGNGVVLDELMRESDKIHNVEFLFPGMLSPHDVGNWMRRSKVLAFPTTPDWLEASPLTPLEAMACGCQIVASDIGGTSENVGPDGKLVVPGNIDCLANALEEALRDHNNEMSSEVIAFLDDRRIENVARLYLDRFYEVLASRS